MISYYLKLGLRNIKRQKIYSIINILGLSIGIALFLIISLYVHNEYSYDKNNANYDQIYRMEFGNWCVIPPGYAHILVDQIPGIEKISRTIYNRNVLYSFDLNNDGSQIKNINAQHNLGVDSTFFEIFDAEFICGSADNALKEPLTIILTERLAMRIFGKKDVLNKTVSFNNEAQMRVDGVIKDPKNSHFMAEAFYSITSEETFGGEGATTNMTSSNYLSYFLFHKGIEPSAVRTNIFNFYKNYSDGSLLDEDDTEEFIILRPLKDIYFFKEAQYESGIKHGNKPIVNSFIIIAIFILLIAGINFINLTTARASLRAKEVGIKKVSGSSRFGLISQFLTESVLVSIIAMVIGLTLLQILLPEFNNIALTNIGFESIFSSQGILILFIIAIIIGVVSGLYPAFYLSYFKPVVVLKGEINSGKKAGAFRKILISFQFIIAAILIAGTFVVNQQIKYLKNKDLGFNKENIINFTLQGKVRRNLDEFKEKLLQNPNILHVSFSHGIPGHTRNTNTFIWNEEPIQVRVTSVDADFFDLYNIELLDGSIEEWKLDSEQRKFVIINESLAKEIGWENPIGHMINRDGLFYNYFMAEDFKIIGVYKDYHLESLHTPVPPLAICRDDRVHWQASIKMSSNNLPQSIKFIEDLWTSYSSNFPFQYTFLDQKFDQMYKSEEKMQKIAIYFSVLAIFIACLGLFGLSAFMTQRRFKEIGIRKVLGASIPQIIRKLSREFAFLVIISNIIAIPLGWLALTKWLEDYPYHVNVQWWVFPVALIITFLVAILTVSFHSLKAAVSNPVDAIRYE